MCPADAASMPLIIRRMHISLQHTDFVGDNRQLWVLFTGSLSAEFTATATAPSARSDDLVHVAARAVEDRTFSLLYIWDLTAEDGRVPVIDVKTTDADSQYIVTGPAELVV